MSLSKSVTFAIFVVLVVAGSSLPAVQATPVTPRECRQLARQAGLRVLRFFRTRECNRSAWFMELRNQCAAGICKGLHQLPCERALIGAARQSSSTFCEPETGLDDLPVAIENFVALDVGFEVPDSCWPSKVCVVIEHPSVGDLTISLRDPANKRTLIVDQVGEGGDNVNACFSNMDRPKVKKAGLDPERNPTIKGNFRPDMPFPSSPVPGPWTLRVFDQKMRNQGTWESATVDFECL